MTTPTSVDEIMARAIVNARELGVDEVPVICGALEAAGYCIVSKEAWERERARTGPSAEQVNRVLGDPAEGVSVPSKAPYPWWW